MTRGGLRADGAGHPGRRRDGTQGQAERSRLKFAKRYADEWRADLRGIPE
jgi:hypothetical protein